VWDRDGVELITRDSVPRFGTRDTIGEPPAGNEHEAIAGGAAIFHPARSAPATTPTGDMPLPLRQRAKLRLKTAGAQAIGLALYELATNAGKYGALSTDTGHVDICWGRPFPAWGCPWRSEARSRLST
jgi:hypothetical protein